MATMEKPSRETIDNLFSKIKASLAKKENERNVSDLGLFMTKGKGGKRVDDKKLRLFASQISSPIETAPMEGVGTSCASTSGESMSTDAAAFSSKSPESPTSSCPSPYASIGGSSHNFRTTSSFAGFRRTVSHGAQFEEDAPKVKPLTWDKPSFGQDPFKTQREDEKARKEGVDAVQNKADTEQLGRKRSCQDHWDGTNALHPFIRPPRNSKSGPKELADFVAFTHKWIPSAKRVKTNLGSKINIEK